MPVSPSEVELIPVPKPEFLLSFLPDYVRQIDERLLIPWRQDENSRGINLILPEERVHIEYNNFDLENEVIVTLYKEAGWTVCASERGFGFRFWFQRPVQQ